MITFKWKPAINLLLAIVQRQTNVSKTQENSSLKWNSAMPFRILRGHVRKNQTKLENSGKNVKTQNRWNSGY